MNDWARWRGLKTLVHDVVAGASVAIERVHKETAARTFAILEHIPVVAEPSRVIRGLHDLAVTGSHAAIRMVNDVVGEGLDVVIDTLAAEEKKKITPG